MTKSTLPDVSAQQRRARWALIAILSTFVATQVARALTADAVNHDVAWTMAAAEKLAEGGISGVDVIDVNPPLIYWLAMCAWWLCAQVQVDPLLGWYLLTALTAAAASVSTYRAARRAQTDPALALALAVVVATSLLPMVGFDVGQRDHLVAIAMVWLAAVCATPSGVGVSAATAAAVAVALKPHHALTMLPIALLERQRGRNATWLALVGVGACYAAAVLLLAPAWLQTARDTIALYGAYDAHLQVPWTALGAALALWLLRRPVERDAASWLRRFAIACSTAALGATLAYVAQQKGFSYHRAPLQALGVCGLGAALLARAPTDWHRHALPAATILCLITTAAEWRDLGRCIAAPRRAEGSEALRELVLRDVTAAQRPTRPVVLVADSASPPAWPMLHFAGLRSALPYSCMWPIAGHYDIAGLAARKARFRYRKLAQMPASEQRFIGRVMTALQNQPQAVLFNVGPVKQGFGEVTFDFRRYFARAPGFAEAMQAYRNVGTLGRFEVWARRSKNDLPRLKAGAAQPAIHAID